LAPFSRSSATASSPRASRPCAPANCAANRRSLRAAAARPAPARARFIDFVQEEVASYSDADIGAAARVVHEGCRKVLREHFTIAPVRSEAEGSRVTLPEGFDAAACASPATWSGQPPFTGSSATAAGGWTDTRLPELAHGHDACA
jgi:hypothetical protein